MLWAILLPSNGLDKRSQSQSFARIIFSVIWAMLLPSNGLDKPSESQSFARRFLIFAGFDTRISYWFYSVVCYVVLTNGIFRSLFLDAGMGLFV